MGAILPFKTAAAESISPRSTTTGLQGDDLVVVVLLILGWVAVTVALLGSVAHGVHVVPFPTH